MIQHLSYSSISTFKTCPRSWYLRYVLNYKEPPNPAYIFGTAVHNAIEKSLFTPQTPAQLFLNEMKFAANKAGVSMRALKRDRETGLAVLNDPMVMDELNRLQPLGREWVERKVLFEIPGVGVPVVGYIDIVCDDGVPLDIKTSTWDWTDDRAAAEAQPKYYLHALDLLGMTGHGGRFRHLIIVKNGGVPRAYTIESVHSNWSDYVIATVQRAWRGIQAREWERITPENHNPDCKCETVLPFNI